MQVHSWQQRNKFLFIRNNNSSRTSVCEQLAHCSIHHAASLSMAKKFNHPIKQYTQEARALDSQGICSCYDSSSSLYPMRCDSSLSPGLPAPLCAPRVTTTRGSADVLLLLLSLSVWPNTVVAATAPSFCCPCSSSRRSSSSMSSAEAFAPCTTWYLGNRVSARQGQMSTREHT